MDNYISARDNLVAGITIVLCAIFLSIKYFPGVENSHYYAGFIMRAIDGTLLAKDPIVGDAIASTTPYKLTAYYLLPKLFGELWLDDRFVLPFYLLSVAATFYLADRISVALGAGHILIRVTVLLLFMRDHQILENHVNFAHHPDFHHSALALPLSLLVLYTAIARKPLWMVIGAGIVLAAVSLQVAPSTLGYALIATLFVGTRNEKRVAGALLIIGFAVFVWGMTNVVHVAESERIELWSRLTTDWYDGMARPFDPVYGGAVNVAVMNMLFGGIMLGAIFWPICGAKNDRAIKLRIIVGIACIVWVALGLFVQFAPASLQYPQILLFPVTRQLQAPQTIAIIALAVFVLNWAYNRPSTGKTLTAGLILLLLVVAGPGNHALWAGLFVVSALAATVLIFVYNRKNVGTGLNIDVLRNPISVLCLTTLLTMTSAIGYAIHDRGADWAQLFRTGIHGSSDAAKWLHIAPYLAQNTPRDSVVLPLDFMKDASRQELQVRRNVASRSARAVPFPMRLSQGLKLAWFDFTEAQYDLLKQITDGWLAGDAEQINAALAGLKPRPDYIIVPEVIADFPGPALAREVVANIDGYTIFKLRGRPSDADR